MKIYLAHSREFDFKNDLYIPVKQSELYENNEVYFPHDEENKNINSKELIRNCDLIIAEVSYSSIGLGIEIGWADFMNKKIVCIYKEGKKFSSSLKFVSNDFIEYKDGIDLIEKLKISNK